MSYSKGKKRVLVLGASIMQLPAIKKAKEMGYHVGVVDYDPTAPGISLADDFYLESTNDIEAATEAAGRFRPDGVITLATDMPVRTAANISEKLNIPGISMDTALKVTDKIEMIKALKEHGVKGPDFWIVYDENELSEIKDSITYPVVLKPRDNSGSRGVILAHNESEILKAYSYSRSFSNDSTVLIEEYLTGKEVSVEMICEKGQAHILAITDKITTGPPHFVEMGHIQPSAFSGRQLIDIKATAVHAVQAVGLYNGPAHVEIMVTISGAKIIELGARMGGDFIASHMVPLSAGIDMVGSAIRNACGEKLELPPVHHMASAIKFISGPPGKLIEIDGLKEAAHDSGISDILVLKDKGYVIEDVCSSLDRVACIIAQGRTGADAMERCIKASEKLTIYVNERET